MIEVRTMLSLAEDYLTERRALGFDLRIPGDQITAFARFVDGAAHTGPLTTRITLDWVQGQAKHAVPFSWARRLDVLRPFARYLTRLDPATEFPQTAIFGRSHRRLAPHIYSEQEICDLLAAARRLAPHGRLRPATYETIFGLIAATGLRLSEALHLQCGNVDLDQGVLTVRNTKFRKSRHVPMHATAVAALDRYMAVRARHGATNRDSFLFLSSSGGPLPTRTIHWVFQKLRAELGWTARGAYAHARIHDLRHTFICRRVQLWHEHGADIDNAMAALSTYVGHAKVSDNAEVLVIRRATRDAGVAGELSALTGYEVQRMQERVLLLIKTARLSGQCHYAGTPDKCRDRRQSISGAGSLSPQHPGLQIEHHSREAVAVGHHFAHHRQRRRPRRLHFADDAAKIKRQFGVEFTRQLLHAPVLGKASHMQHTKAAVAGGE